MRMSLQTVSRSSMPGSKMKELRRSGQVPAGVYLRNGTSEQCTVSAHDLEAILRQGGQSALIELKHKGRSGTQLVIPLELQRDSITRKLLHAAFKIVSSEEPTTADVHVVLIGHPEVSHQGAAALEQVASSLHVRALPDNLPQHLDADVSGMTVGSVLHVSDLPQSDTYEIVSPADTIVAVYNAVRGPAVEEVAPVVTAESADAAAAPAPEG